MQHQSIKLDQFKKYLGQRGGMLTGKCAGIVVRAKQDLCNSVVRINCAATRAANNATKLSAMDGMEYAIAVAFPN